MYPSSIRNFDTATEYLGSKDDRPLPGRATRIQRRGDDIVIHYQATDVVTYKPDGTTILDSGGWRTPTTKQRMNDYANAGIFQHKGIWFMGGWDTRIAFNEGAIVKDGVLLNPPPIEDTARVASTKRKLDAAITRYIDGYLRHAIERGGLEEPGNGDCWGCLMVATPHPELNDALAWRERGDVMGVSHLLDHFDERYYVPTLAFRAVKEHGWNNPAFILSMCNADLKAGHRSDWLRRSMRGYFKRRANLLVEEMMRRAEVAA